MKPLNSIVAASVSFIPLVHAGKPCTADACLQIVHQYPWLNGEVSTFCESFIHSTPCPRTVTTTVTAKNTLTITGTGAHITDTVTIPDTVTPQPVSVSSTETVTITETASTTLSPIIISSDVTITSISTSDLVCSTTVTSALTFATYVDYVLSGSAPNPGPTKRAVHDGLEERGGIDVASMLREGCKGKACNPFSAHVSSACSCFLTTPTVYHTKTVTKTATIPGQPVTTFATQTALTTFPTQTVTVTVIATSTALYTVPAATITSTFTSIATIGVSLCTSTSTSTVFTYNGGALSCGAQTFTAVPSSTTSASSISCSPQVPTPSLNAYFRIEGLQSGEGTIFEGCILSGPREVTTPSGGTHECDGTNDGANPDPGTTPTDMIDAAGKQNGFGYDGTYESQYQDYFISSISQTSQSGDDYWGVMDNLVYTPTGGCQYEADPGDTVEWIYNAFNYNSFLQVSPAYVAVQAGQGSFLVSVTETDGNGGGFSPAPGASIAGQTTGSNGDITLFVPSSPGCYQYKALDDGSAPSNALFLAVFPDGTFSS